MDNIQLNNNIDEDVSDMFWGKFKFWITFVEGKWADFEKCMNIIWRQNVGKFI